jgi:hypothetical protein
MAGGRKGGKDAKNAKKEGKVPPPFLSHQPLIPTSAKEKGGRGGVPLRLFYHHDQKHLVVSKHMARREEGRFSCRILNV